MAGASSNWIQPSLRDYSSLTAQPRTPSFGLRPGLSSGRPFRGWIIRVLTRTLKPSLAAVSVARLNRLRKNQVPIGF
jgi:hypothetical protein